jgi:hypothetical protein
MNFKNIDCDEYLIEDRDTFIKYIENLSLNTCKNFPIVFNDGKFIGNDKEGFWALWDKLSHKKRQNKNLLKLLVRFS